MSLQTTIPPVAEAQRAAKLAALAMVKIRDQMTNWGYRHMDGSVDPDLQRDSADGDFLDRSPAEQSRFLEDLLEKIEGRHNGASPTYAITLHHIIFYFSG